MRKNILLGILVLLFANILFAQSQDDDLKYYEYRLSLFPLPLEDIFVSGYPGAVGRIHYIGKNRMEQTYSEYVRFFQRRTFGHMYTNDVKLLKAEEDAINMLLDRYNTTRGDTFTIGLNAIRYEHSMSIILEFISDTQYSYYVWLEN